MNSLVYFGVLMVLVALLTALSTPSKPSRIRFVSSFTWTLVWLTIPLVFCFLLYLTEPLQPPEPGGTRPFVAPRFLAVYLSGISLTTLNLLLMALFLARWKLPSRDRRRVLGVGLVGIVAARLVGLPAGLYVMEIGGTPAGWMTGYLLVFGLLTLLYFNPFDTHVVRRLKKWFHGGVPGTRRTRRGTSGSRDGKKTFPRAVVVAGAVLLGLDLAASLAAAPLAWSYSRHATIVLGANLFSVLGLWSLYGLLAGLLRRLRPLMMALGGLVTFSAGLLLLEGAKLPGLETRLPFLLGIVCVGVLASLMWGGPRGSGVYPPPARPFDLGTVLLNHARRIVVAVVGFSLILVGLVLLLLPGPGLLSILGGLAVLSVEFVWAGRLLRRARNQFDESLNWVRNQTKKPPDPPDKNPGTSTDNDEVG